MKKILLASLMVLVATIVFGCQRSTGNTVLVSNPYDNVEWKSVQHVLANLHTHTTHSDGQSTPHDVVDYYHTYGYGILSITDHDLLTYPWNFSALSESWEDRDPDALGMLAIPGNEYSINHHVVGIFTDYVETTSESLESTLSQLFAQELALGWFAHPGRYWRIYTEYEPEDEYSPEWYMNFFNTYPKDQLLGIEIINRQNNRPFDRSLWDLLLTQSMPERPIWGFAADDFHGPDSGVRMRWAYTYHLMQNALSIEQFRQGLINGAFYFSYTALEEDTAPKIESININTRQRYIEIKASDYEYINWISGNDPDHLTSSVVHTGNRFYYSGFSGNYIRAEIIKVESGGRAAITYTQPFGFDQD